jgi:hypothetical protein
MYKLVPRLVLLSSFSVRGTELSYSGLVCVWIWCTIKFVNEWRHMPMPVLQLNYVISPRGRVRWEQGYIVIREDLRHFLDHNLVYSVARKIENVDSDSEMSHQPPSLPSSLAPSQVQPTTTTHVPTSHIHTPLYEKTRLR